MTAEDKKEQKRIYQANFRAKQKEKGIRAVTLWVRESDMKSFKLITEMIKDGKFYSKPLQTELLKLVKEWEDGLRKAPEVGRSGYFEKTKSQYKRELEILKNLAEALYPVQAK
ncbi:hypothetical protein [Neisseria polysaccharea]|uniref:hypothetical protein n=1 Tax=Neisseria polysaccharea TaxID=489 RepID=UPI00272CB51A|nr:hypothetical protein [Neisseria polysaccharea]